MEIGKGDLGEKVRELAEVTTEDFRNVQERKALTPDHESYPDVSRVDNVYYPETKDTTKRLVKVNRPDSSKRKFLCERPV